MAEVNCTYGCVVGTELSHTMLSLVHDVVMR